MECLEIKQSKNLRGIIEISGAKNSALPNIAATILTDQPVILNNIPDLLDVRYMISLLKSIGSDIDKIGENSWIFSLKEPITLEANYEIVEKMRASILVLGSMLSRFGEAKVALPGGCPIGLRPIDLHLKALEKMGVKISKEHGFIVARGKPKGAHIVFEKITVTGTENIMMAAVLAEGETVIENAALEPEVVDLAILLQKMGADISWDWKNKSRTIRIRGVKKLKGTVHNIIPDRIEAGTFVVLSALTNADIILKNYPYELLTYVHYILKNIGIHVIQIDKDSVIVRRKESLTPAYIETKEYPYFPTDLQAQFMTLLSVVDGLSIIKENIFENRFLHVPELNRLGAKIEVSDNKVAVIDGVKKLTGAEVKATDLRASAAILDRGYERIDYKLKMIGAEIERKRITKTKVKTN